MNARRCKCGWARPLIAASTIDGQRPPPNLVLAYACPECGLLHAAADVSDEQAASVYRDLTEYLTRKLREGAKQMSPLCTGDTDAAGIRRAPPFERWEYGEHGTFIIRGRDCEICLVPRPPYCDRGNWIAMLEARGVLARDLDGADLWPRYYFDLDRAFLECEAWLQKRGQWIEAAS